MIPFEFFNFETCEFLAFCVALSWNEIARVTDPDLGTQAMRQMNAMKKSLGLLGYFLLKLCSLILV